MDKVLDEIIKHHEEKHDVKIDAVLRDVLKETIVKYMDDLVEMQAKRIKNTKRLEEYKKIKD